MAILHTTAVCCIAETAVSLYKVAAVVTGGVIRLLWLVKAVIKGTG